MLPSLRLTAGIENVLLTAASTGAEDFSFYQQRAPGIYFVLGGMPKGGDPIKAPSHHTPDFFIDESGLKLGAKALANLTIDYMEMNNKKFKNIPIGIFMQKCVTIIGYAFLINRVFLKAL